MGKISPDSTYCLVHGYPEPYGDCRFCRQDEEDAYEHLYEMFKDGEEHNINEDDPRKDK